MDTQKESTRMAAWSAVVVVSFVWAMLTGTAGATDEPVRTESESTPKAADLAADKNAEAPALPQVVDYASEGPVVVFDIVQTDDDAEAQQCRLLLQAVGSVTLASGDRLENGEELYIGDMIVAGVFKNAGEATVELLGPNQEPVYLEPNQYAYVGLLETLFPDYYIVCRCSCQSAWATFYCTYVVWPPRMECVALFDSGHKDFVLVPLGSKPPPEDCVFLNGEFCSPGDPPFGSTYSSCAEVLAVPFDDDIPDDDIQSGTPEDEDTEL